MAAPRAQTVARIEFELTRLARVLEAVRRHRSYPIEPAQYLHLCVLKAEGPRTVASLAARLLLDASTVTRQIAVMEVAGLVTRQPHPTDSRSHLIAPTAFGLARAEEMRAARAARVAELIADWPEGDRADLARLLERLSLGLIGQIERSLADSG